MKKVKPLGFIVGRSIEHLQQQTMTGRTFTGQADINCVSFRQASKVVQKWVKNGPEYVASITPVFGPMAVREWK